MEKTSSKKLLALLLTLCLVLSLMPAMALTAFADDTASSTAYYSVAKDTAVAGDSTVKPAINPNRAASGAAVDSSEGEDGLVVTSYNHPEEAEPEEEIYIDATSGDAVVFTAKALSDMADALAADGVVAVETKTGNLVLDKTSLKALASQVGGKDLKLSVEPIDIKSLTPGQETALLGLKVRDAFELSITADKAPLDDLGGGVITFAVPYVVPTGTKEGDYRVVYASPDGEPEVMFAVFAEDMVVVMSNHASVYAVVYDPDGKLEVPDAPVSTAPAEETKVQVSKQTLTVDGEEKTAEKYNINDYNYFKLRDIAMLLNGTDAQFAVTYDAEKNSVVIETGEAYEAVGGELEDRGDLSDTCKATRQTVIVDGETVDADAFNIGGNNFFKLRDLGELLGFGVEYEAETNTAQILTK